MSDPQLGPTPAQITMMSHNIAAKITVAKAQRRRRVRLSIAAGGVAVAIALSAAGIRAATAPAEVQQSGFSCFTADDAGSPSHGVIFFDDPYDPTNVDRVATALEMCDIVFGDYVIYAPHPTACELPDLRLGVFPNLRDVEPGEFCRSLGLGRPS